MIMPEAYSGIHGDAYATAGGVTGVLSSLLCVVGMVALLIGVIMKLATQTKIAAVRDPRFRESMAFEQIF